ncbi:MAG: hypothetical protein IPK99_10920 [Flavobacteriales bacterium]|nr:hypothetical protein [Flavobacteriales bacterium]
MPRFVDVIIPAAVPGVFTYGLPEGALDVAPGMRVVVPFGSGRKLYAAMVLSTHQKQPEHRSIRTALSVLDHQPVISLQQLELWQRMADHYLCGLGEVMLTAMPGPLILTSNTRIIATEHTAEHAARTPRLALLLAALEKQPAITLAEAGDLLQVQDPLRVVKELVDQGAVGLEEDLRQKYKPRTEIWVTLAEDASNEQALHAWFDRLERAPKQLAALMKGIELGRWLSDDPSAVLLPRLMKAADVTRAIVDGLARKGLLLVTEKDAHKPFHGLAPGIMPTLSAAQEAALTALRASSVSIGAPSCKVLRDRGKQRFTRT